MDINNSIIWLAKLMRGIIVYFVFSRLILSNFQIRQLIIFFLGLSCFESIIAIFQFFGKSLIRLPIQAIDNFYNLSRIEINYAANTFFRATGTLEHPNTLGAFISFFLPINIFFILTTESNYKRAIFILTLLLNVTGVILTLSRWGLITALFSLILTLIICHKYLGATFSKLKNRLTIWVILFVIPLIIFAGLILKERYSTYLQRDDRSLTTRVELFNQSMYLIRENFIFGIGPNNFRKVLVNNDFSQSEISERYIGIVHNLYLLILTEIGIFGIIIFLLIVAEFAFIFIKKAKFLERVKKEAASLFFLAIAVYFFNSLWDWRILTTNLEIFFWLFLGLFVNLVYGNKLYSSHTVS